MGLQKADAPDGAKLIAGLRGDRFVADGEARSGAFLIWPDGIADVALDDIAALDERVLAPILELDPPRDVILIGSGAAMAWPNMDVFAALRERGLGPEVMDSRAAARTYNLLVAEDRAVAALILPLR